MWTATLKIYNPAVITGYMHNDCQDSGTDSPE